MIIIPRATWGRRFAAGFGPAPRATELWLHHSVTESAGPGATPDEDYATMRKLEAIGQQRFGGGVSYTFAVTAAGRVLEGTGGLRLGAHTGGRNTRARAICLLGNHSRTRPTEPQIDAVAALIRHGRAVGWWTCDRLSGGHRDAPGAATGCPGDAAWATIPTINNRALSAHLDDDGDDDEMTPEDRERLERLERGQEIILQQLLGPGATVENPFPGVQRGGGWPHWRYNHPEPAALTLADYLRSVDRQLNSGLTLEGRPGHPDALDDAWGHSLSTRAELLDVAAELRQMLTAVAAQVGVPMNRPGGGA